MGVSVKHLFQGLVAALPLAALSPASHGASTETVLVNFGPSGDKTIGASPYSPLIFDPHGNLYGTTASGGKYSQGTVFKLTPPAAGGTAWTQTAIFSFNGTTNGGYPTSGLVMDAKGNLYGTTQGGGAYLDGVAYKLTPPTTGTSWVESVIAVFDGSNGNAPTNAAMIFDSKGNLYGTTEAGGNGTLDGRGYGVVFELAPPTTGSRWTESVLCRFTATNGEGPAAKLTFDPDGNLYGTTQYGGAGPSPGYGVVFKLTKPPLGKTAWTESVIATFTGADGNGANPIAGVVFDNTGNLYGTTQYGGGGPSVSGGNGVVFMLSPPNASTKSWTPSVLLNLGGSYGVNSAADPVFDKQGNIYVTTEGGGASNSGTVVKLTKPTSASGTWTPTVLYNFTYAKGQNPAAGLIFDTKFANLFGTTSSGGKNAEGVAFKLTP
jgi:uncharacterized repeat protein (TIGR03803 family)